MTRGEELTQEEAKRLMLQRLVDAPDAWRNRASAAGGFLGAAAAVSFWGLTNSTERFTQEAIVAACIASACYVLAVAAFLGASVWQPPKATSQTTQDFFESTRQYVELEAAPIKRLVHIGGILAVIAIASTTVCSVLLLMPSHARSALVVVHNEGDMEAIEKLCPGIPTPFRANVLEATSNELVLNVRGVTCREDRTVVTVSRDSAVVSELDSQ